MNFPNKQSTNKQLLNNKQLTTITMSSMTTACKFLDDNQILAVALENCDNDELGFHIIECGYDDSIDNLIKDKFLDNNYYKTFNYSKVYDYIMNENNIETTKKLFDHLENYGISLQKSTEDASIDDRTLFQKEMEIYDKIMGGDIHTFAELFEVFDK